MQRKTTLLPLQMLFKTQTLFVGLLLARVLCAANLEAPWKWIMCGVVEPPKGHSVLNFTSSTVNLDSNGVLYCSCREGIHEDFTFSVVNEEEKIVAQANAIVYPCLKAECSAQVNNQLKISSFTSIELLPKECNEIVKLHKTSDTIELFNFNESHTEYCHKSPKIILSQRHVLNNPTDTVDMSSMSTSRTLSIKNYIVFDMDSCAEAVKQGHSATIVFHSAEGSTQRKRTLNKRDNNPPLFLKNYYSVEVVENVAVGSRVTVVQASDIDQGINGELTYTMQPASNQMSADYFAINSTTGKIVTTGMVA